MLQRKKNKEKFNIKKQFSPFFTPPLRLLDALTLLLLNQPVYILKKLFSP